MSRTRMLYIMGGESLNDVPKSERYKAPPLQIIPDEPTEEPFIPEAPGPTPSRPVLPKYIQKAQKRRAQNAQRAQNAVLNAPGPSREPTPNQAPQPSRISKRARKAPSRLIEE